MFRVTGSDGMVYGLVTTREEADAIVHAKKHVGRDGKPIKNPVLATKSSTMSFTVE